MTLHAVWRRSRADATYERHDASLAFSLAGILGASLAPYIATWLAQHYGLSSVGWYLAGSAVLTLIGLAMVPETGAIVLE